MNQGQTKIVAYLAIAAILISSGLTVGSIMGFNNPLGDYIATGLGFDVTTDEPLDIAGGSARVNSIVYKLGVESTYPSTTVLIWYDWDGDGVKDYGDRNAGEGEIETKSSSSSAGFTTGYYPLGAVIEIQLQASGYQVVEYTRTVEGTPDANGIVYIDNMPVMLIDTSITVTMDAVGTAGTVAMVTSSGDYNYTTNGVSPTCTIRIACGTSDAGIGGNGYTDWITGKAYHGSFVALSIALTEKSSAIFGSYDYLLDDGTNQWVVWDLNNPIFNDASLDDDGSGTVVFGLTITGAFDIDYINVYDTCLATNFGQATFGTQDGQETDLDFVA